MLPEPMQAETCERPPLERAVFRWLMSLGSAVTTALAAAAGAGRAPDAWTQASRGLSAALSHCSAARESPGRRPS